MVPRVFSSSRPSRPNPQETPTQRLRQPSEGRAATKAALKLERQQEATKSAQVVDEHVRREPDRIVLQYPRMLRHILVICDL